MPKRVVSVVGTRPEAIKMAPVHKAMAARRDLEPLMVLTGQHREQLEQALAIFDVPVAANLDVMQARQGLPELAAAMLPGLARIYRDQRPDMVLVHGDTLTTFVAAWAAFLEKIPVGHVEAGLRSHNLREPFPEEVNRRLTDTITDLALAPTAGAKANLVAEGLDPHAIVVTGQTGIDAIQYAAGRQVPLPFDVQQPYCVVTLHRRENWPRLRALAQGLAAVAQRFPDYSFVYPVHLNPTVREAVTPALLDVPNFVLTEPLDYGAMAKLLAGATLIITDSGGLQEEGAALGVPVVVARNVTERPEGVEAGILHLAGVEADAVATGTSQILADPALRLRMARAKNPYGDGHASKRVADAVAWRLGFGPQPPDFRR